ncbi:MAG: DivIVA domain-containing protein [Ruminococcaceae bacterium]|nr:DivIVA domain-containing protein [Oscillospiraceae bacterium]
MMTPQEMRQIVFDKAVFGGYDMAAVDEFIEQAALDFTAMHKENNTLKSKMKVLVETIEEYRREQEASKQQLAEAKAAADKLLAETERKCALMLQQAEAEASTFSVRYKAEAGAEEDRLNRAKILTANYVDRVKQVCAQHLQLLDELTAVDLSQSTVVRQAAAAVTQQEPAQSEPEPVVDEIPEPVVEAEENNDMIVVDEAPAPEVEPKEDDSFKSGDTVIMRFKSDELPPLPVSEPEAVEDATDEDDVFAEILRAANGEKEETPAVTQKTSKFEFINLQFGKDYDFNK